MTDTQEKDFFYSLENWGAEPAAALAETFMNDRKLFYDCLFRLREDDSLPQLRAALASHDKTVAIRGAHTLKGVANNLGLLPLADAAVSVLEDLRADAFDRAVAGLPEVEARYNEVESLISKYRSAED